MKADKFSGIMWAVWYPVDSWKLAIVGSSGKDGIYIMEIGKYYN
jgi:hypothetical protein